MFSQSLQIEIQTKETQIILIIKTIWIFKKLSQYSVVKFYKVLLLIFSNRIVD